MTTRSSLTGRFLSHKQVEEYSMVAVGFYDYTFEQYQMNNLEEAFNHDLYWEVSMEWAERALSEGTQQAMDIMWQKVQEYAATAVKLRTLPGSGAVLQLSKAADRRPVLTVLYDTDTHML